jgi:hypothetical protein
MVRTLTQGGLREKTRAGEVTAWHGMIHGVPDPL